MTKLETEFDQTWRELEAAIQTAVSSRALDKTSDLSAAIDALRRAGAISASEADGLHELRRLRNARAHPGSGRSGIQLFAPTLDAVELAQWFVDRLHGTPRVHRLMKPGHTCEASERAIDVAGRIRENDFDVIPYRHKGTWQAFCRVHLTEWIALESDTGESDAVSLPRSLTVGDVVDLVGPRYPVTVSPRMYVRDAVEKLNDLCRGKAEASHAPLLIAPTDDAVLVMSPYDLPAALELLTPPV